MQTLGEFKLPNFFNYPPYFTLQPVRETRDKQIQLWKELILDFCRTQKIFSIGLEEDFPLFSNPGIERSLSHEAKEAFLSALVSEGRAEWLDKGNRKCLILWHRIQDWADLILRFVKDNGFEDSVMTVEEIRSGVESTRDRYTFLVLESCNTIYVRGTLSGFFPLSIFLFSTWFLRLGQTLGLVCPWKPELHGMDRTILKRALKQLEHKGKLVIFKGTSADDEGVKFSL
ncbi:vacuolar protein sorting-associated protein 25-like isoform X2 [Primulina eburnea]